MKQLTEAQKRAVELLKNHEAIEADGCPWWISGICEEISRSTMNALVKRGIVEIYRPKCHLDDRARLVKEV